MNLHKINIGEIGDDPSSECFFLPIGDFKKAENT